MTVPLIENPDHRQQLCTLLDIGSQRSELCRVYGGFHHTMWRLETDCGRFAVKQLSPDTDLADAAIISHYNATEAVAEAFAGHGIPALCAVKRHNQYLQVLENIAYLVYPWSDARAVAENQISEQHALTIARVLASMHRANIKIADLQEAPFDFHPEEKIIFLVQQALQGRTDNACALNEHLPTLLAIAASQQAAIPVLQQHVVISHGDLDHKNVLWTPAGSPVLIDWESARRLNPTYEIVNGAMDWSGITSHFDFSLFADIIVAYSKAGGEIESDAVQASLHCILGDWVNWLMYNVGRSVGLEDAEQHRLGQEQVELALTTLLRLQQLLPQLLRAASNSAGTARRRERGSGKPVKRVAE